MEVCSLLDRLLEISLSILTQLSTDVKHLHATTDDNEYKSSSAYFSGSSVCTSGSIVHQTEGIRKLNNTRQQNSTLYSNLLDLDNGQDSVEPNEWDDVSWFFMPEEQPSPEPLALPSVQPSTISGTTKYPSCTHTAAEDDDDFADCFDSMEDSAPIPSTRVSSNSINDVSWLNKALNSVTSLTRSKTYRSYKSTNSYSRNMTTAIENDPQEPKPPSKHSDSPSLNTLSPNAGLLDFTHFKGVIHGISRGDDLIAQLLTKAVDKLRRVGERIQPSDIDSIHIVRVEGPLSHMSDVYDGLIVRSNVEITQVLAGRTNFRALVGAVIE